MIWTITVKLVFGMYAESSWQGTLEVESASTLADLHDAIQYALEFDDDHMYEFYISRTERSRDRVKYDAENEGIYTKTIESIFPLTKDRKLFYLFDYGDSWFFQVSQSRKKPFSAEPGINYPRLAAEKGVKPRQYPEWE